MHLFCLHKRLLSVIKGSVRSIVLQKGNVLFIHDGVRIIVLIKKTWFSRERGAMDQDSVRDASGRMGTE